MDQLLTDEEFQTRLAELRGKRFPVLSHGGITLMDAMGSDRRIVDAARTTSDLQGKGDADDRNLLRYLLRHHHGTPFEFPQLTFLIECPMDTWRQAIRHRMSSVNEFSSRYSTVPDINDVTDPDSWRLQSQTNRQGSAGDFVTDWPADWLVVEDENHKIGEFHRDGFTIHMGSGTTPGQYLSAQETSVHGMIRNAYEERLKFGVAKEQARKDLCLSTYTRAYWHWDLRNLLHFLGLRMDSHAQLEIRLFANQMGEIVQHLFPVSWMAFSDYQLNALTLSTLDQQVIRNLSDNFLPPDGLPIATFLKCQHKDWVGIAKSRERDECLAKLQKLGLVASS